MYGTPGGVHGGVAPIGVAGQVALLLSEAPSCAIGGLSEVDVAKGPISGDSYRRGVSARPDQHGRASPAHAHPRVMTGGLAHRVGRGQTRELLSSISQAGQSVVEDRCRGAARPARIQICLFDSLVKRVATVRLHSRPSRRPLAPGHLMAPHTSEPELHQRRARRSQPLAFSGAKD